MGLSSGTRLGPYEVLDLLGAGGMGEVYRARDSRLDRLVALKVLPEALAADAPSRVRFEREARAISALSHPHICALHDVGRQDDTEYLVLELLEGETLAARLARGGLPLSQVLRIGGEIAEALAAAHRLNIVHRDLKPGNVMLTPTGVKLLDFGLAKPAPVHMHAAVTGVQTGGATAHGTIVGTLQYMAPEQAQGLDADARSDIFALGAILHEMATGTRAFDAQTHAGLIAKLLETDPPPVSTVVPLAPPVFDQLVQRCLAKDPADRWQSAHDLALQLRWLQMQVSSATTVTTVAARPTRRSAWLPWAVAAVAVVGAAAAAFVAATRAGRGHAGRAHAVRCAAAAAGAARGHGRRSDLARRAAARVRREPERPAPAVPARPGLAGDDGGARHRGRYAPVLVSGQPHAGVLRQRRAQGSPGRRGLPTHPRGGPVWRRRLVGARGHRVRADARRGRSPGS
jgi:hypothetical protein